MWKDTVRELSAYTGIDDKPSDFDAYWQRALREVDALPLECEMTPAPLPLANAECFELYFTGVGGARIHCRYARPKGHSRKLPAICLFHGYSIDCGDFWNLLPWTAAGFAVLSMTCRGQGDGQSDDMSSAKGNTFVRPLLRGIEDPDPDKLYYRNVYLDTAQAARLLMHFPEVDALRIGVLGGSQGGGLTLACASLVPEINRVIAAAPFLCDFRGGYENGMELLELGYLFSRCDPAHEREDALFERLGYIDVMNLVPRIRARTRFVIGLKDVTVLPCTQFAAYNRITAPKDRIIYPDFDHPAVPDMEDGYIRYMLEMNEDN